MEDLAGAFWENPIISGPFLLGGHDHKLVWSLREQYTALYFELQTGQLW